MLTPGLISEGRESLPDPLSFLRRDPLPTFPNFHRRDKRRRWRFRLRRRIVSAFDVSSGRVSRRKSSRFPEAAFLQKFLSLVFSSQLRRTMMSKFQ